MLTEGNIHQESIKSLFHNSNNNNIITVEENISTNTNTNTNTNITLHYNTRIKIKRVPVIIIYGNIKLLTSFDIILLLLLY